MKFQPKTEDEIARESLLAPGTYDFEVLDAEDKVSAKGNDMIALKLSVFDADGDRRIVFDYLLESMPHKLRHAAYVCQLGQEYEAGTLEAADFVQKVGRVKIGIREDKTGNYPPRNSVQDYVSGGAVQDKQVKRPAMAGSDLDDEIPF